MTVTPLARSSEPLNSTSPIPLQISMAFVNHFLNFLLRTFDSSFNWLNSASNKTKANTKDKNQCGEEDDTCGKNRWEGGRKRE